MIYEFLSSGKSLIIIKLLQNKIKMEIQMYPLLQLYFNESGKQLYFNNVLLINNYDETFPIYFRTCSFPTIIN